MAIIGSNSITGITTAYEPGDFVTKSIVDDSVRPLPPFLPSGQTINRITPDNGRLMDNGYTAEYNRPYPGLHNAAITNNESVNLYKRIAFDSYTTPGTYTYTVPSNATAIEFDIQAGGGGGGYASTDTSSYVTGSSWAGLNFSNTSAAAGMQSGFLSGAAIGNNAFVICGDSKGVYANESSNCAYSQWRRRTVPIGPNYSLHDAAYINGMYHVVGNGAVYVQSTDSIHWVARTVHFSDNYIFDYLNGYYFCGMNSYRVTVSTDSIVWTIRTVAQTSGSLSFSQITGMAYHNSAWFVSCAYGSVRYSTDTIIWDRYPGSGTIDTYGRITPTGSYAEGGNPLTLTTNGTRMLFRYGYWKMYNGYFSQPYTYMMSSESLAVGTFSYANFPNIRRPVASGSFYTFRPATLVWLPEINRFCAAGVAYGYGNGFATFCFSTDGLLWIESFYGEGNNSSNPSDYANGIYLWDVAAHPTRGILAAGAWNYSSPYGAMIFGPGPSQIPGFGAGGGAGGAFAKIVVPVENTAGPGSQITLNVGQGGRAGDNNNPVGGVGGASTISWTDDLGIECSVTVPGGVGGSSSPETTAQTSFSPTFQDYRIITYGGSGAGAHVTGVGDGKDSPDLSESTAQYYMAQGGGGGAFTDSSTSTSSKSYWFGGKSGNRWTGRISINQTKILGFNSVTTWTRKSDSFGAWGGKGGSIVRSFGGYFKLRYAFDKTIRHYDQNGTTGDMQEYLKDNQLKKLNNMYVTPFSNGVAYSTDGITWFESTVDMVHQHAGRAGSIPKIHQIDYFNGHWVVNYQRYGTFSTTKNDFTYIYKSTDLINWKFVDLPIVQESGYYYNVRRLVASPNLLVVSQAYRNSIYISTDIITWTKLADNTAYFTEGVATSMVYDSDNQIFGAGGGSSFVTSTDGLTWTNRTAPRFTPGNTTSFQSIDNVYYGGGKWLASGLTGSYAFFTIITSTDAIHWFHRTTSFGRPYSNSVVSAFYYDPVDMIYFVAADGEGDNMPTGYSSQIRLSTSTDTIVWAMRTTATLYNANGFKNWTARNRITGICRSTELDSEGHYNYLYSISTGNSYSSGDPYFGWDHLNGIFTHTIGNVVYDAQNGVSGSGGGGAAWDIAPNNKGNAGSGGNGYININVT